MELKQAEERIAYLRQVIERNNRLYYEQDAPELEDYEYDALTKELKALEAEGMLGQVVLSMDLTRKSHLAYKGGIGYSYLIETFLPMLKEAGIAEESIQKMLVDNPKRILYGE